MNKQNRRFIFIDFADLKKIKFKKLEKVCDKIFVFIKIEEEFVPFELVQQMQGLGKDVKWVVIDNQDNENMNYHMCFLLGRLHQKVDNSVEFAILSNDSSFDALVSYINDSARSCIRVKHKKSNNEDVLLEDEPQILESKAFVAKQPFTVTTPPQDDFPLVEDEIISDGNIPSFQEKNDISLVDLTAKDTVERLLRSGNRPQDVSMLKNYISLNNKDIKTKGDVDQIIARLQETEEIEVHQGEVTYHF